MCPSAGRETLRTTCLIPGNAGFLSAASPTSSHRREKVGRFSLAAAAYGPCRRRQARDDYGLPLNHLRRLGIKHRLDRSDGLLDLLIAHRLNPSRMLDFHFPRHQQGANLHVGRRLLPADLRDSRGAMLLEVGSEGEQKVLVERPTRSLPLLQSLDAFATSGPPTIGPSISFPRVFACGESNSVWLIRM